MLPNPEYGPSRRLEDAIGLGIPLPVRAQLGLPELGVRHRSRVVQRATVPEAAVHEHRETLPPKDKVRLAAHAFDRSRIDRIAETNAVDGGPQCQFGRGMPASTAVHG